jgi:hypothetical protein
MHFPIPHTAFDEFSALYDELSRTFAFFQANYHFQAFVCLIWDEPEYEPLSTRSIANHALGKMGSATYYLDCVQRKKYLNSFSAFTPGF